MKFKVLSVDAWADIEDNWTWNNWHYIDTYDDKIEGPLNENNALKFFFLSLGYKGDFLKFKSQYYIDDDQYNLVLCDKKDFRPLYAIEYGNKY